MSNETKKSEAKALLSSLTGKKPASKPAAKASRPEMELPVELVDAFKRFIGASALEEVVEARCKQEKDALDDECFKAWTDRLWKAKTRPANPSLKLDKDGSLDMSAIFQVHERYVMNLDEVPEGKTHSEVATKTFSEALSEAGMTPVEAITAATNLVDNELDFTPKTYIDFNKLVNGHYEGEGKNRTFVEASEAEQGVAAKVLGLLQCRTKEDLAAMEPLTENEAVMVLEEKYSIVVKPGFLQRVFTYVKSLEQLKAVFSIVKPIRYPSHMKFGISDTPEVKNKRLLAEAKEILGVR